jgi:hypothetical protein
MRTITVTVTQAHIDKGDIQSCASCPIALALSAMGEHYIVDCAALYRNSAGKYDWVARLPDSAIRFINDFDSGFPVEPFAFEVEL